MEKIHFSIHINAPQEKVWDVMLSDKTYREWTAAFNPGSYFKGDWNEGSEIMFLGPNGSDTNGAMGMYSRIKESRKPEFISIQHLGIVMNGVKDTTSDMAKKWAPAFENYTFTQKDGGTELSIDMDIVVEEKNTFEDMWPKALKRLKEVVER